MNHRKVCELMTQKENPTIKFRHVVHSRNTCPSQSLQYLLQGAQQSRRRLSVATGKTKKVSLSNHNMVNLSVPLKSLFGKKAATEEALPPIIRRAIKKAEMSPKPSHRLNRGPIPRPRRGSKYNRCPTVGYKWVELDGEECFLVCELYRPT